MKKYLFAAIALAPLAAPAETAVTGPDGRMVVDFTLSPEGVPSYSVTYDGIPFVQPSPLGLITDLGYFTSGMTLGTVSDVEQVTDSYSLPNIKKSHVDYNANRRVYTLCKDGTPAIDIIFQASDNDLALRYKLHPRGDSRVATVRGEATTFAMPAGVTTYLCPQARPMGGFARTSPSYETSYTLDDTTGKNGWGEGYTFPCLFRNGDSGWTLISETGVAGDYCASHLTGNPDGSYTIAYPMPGEMNGLGSTHAGVPLPGYTPWRTITVGRDLTPVVETTVMFDVVKPLYAPSRQYEYGKGTWSWIMKMDPSCNPGEQRRYIDFSNAMGYTSVLVDALWDTQIGRDGIEELARYGREKGVSLYLWYNSNGYWNDAPQGPRGMMDDPVRRRAEMAWMRDNGIRGIKVDFFGGDKQEMMRLYHDILTDANDHGLLVIFHGCTLPRGWERMYPNYAASEAVLASENMHFSQGSCDTEALCATIHPFIRNTVGSMDFGGSALNKNYNADNRPGKGSERRTSDVFAQATAVLFQSPVQHFALAPNNLDNAPAWAIDFMKQVPTLWDETCYIDGYPGHTCVLARRHGDTWYIAGVNGTDEPQTTRVKLPDDIDPSRLTLYHDNTRLEGSVDTVKPGRGNIIKVTMPRNGAFVLIAPRRPE